MMNAYLARKAMKACVKAHRERLAALEAAKEAQKASIQPQEKATDILQENSKSSI